MILFYHLLGFGLWLLAGLLTFFLACRRYGKPPDRNYAIACCLLFGPIALVIFTYAAWSKGND